MTRFSSLLFGAALLALPALLMPQPASAFAKRHIFVTNRGGNNILELDDKLVLVKVWFATAGLSVPNGMAFTPDGSVFVADSGNHRILGFDENGVQLVAFSVAPFSAGAVESLNFDAKGVLYASSNPGDGRVIKTDMQGKLIGNLVSDPLYVGLGNVNFTKSGNIIIADFSGLGRGIREVDTAGNLVATFGQEANLYYEDMVVDGADRIFASRFSKNDIIVFDPQRVEQRTFTAPGLTNPTGIVLTWDCRIVVASYGSAELYEFEHDGTFRRKVTVAGMSLPESLAIVGQRLTGSFGHGSTMEPTPSCDPPTPPVDAFPVADAGPADASPPADAISASDIATAGDQVGGKPPTTEGTGCSCRLGSAWTSLSWTLLPLLLLLLLANRRRRPRRCG